MSFSANYIISVFKTCIKSIIKKSIYGRFIIIMLLISIIPLSATAVFTFFFSRMTVENEFISNSNKNLKQLSENIDYNIRQMEIISKLVLTDKYAQESLKRIKKLDYVINNEDIKKIRQLLVSMSILREDISAIYIYAGKFVFYDGRLDTGVSEDQEFNKRDWYKTVTSANGSKVLFSTHKPFYFKSSDKYVFSLSRSIISTGTDEFLGVILIDSNFDLIKNLFDSSKNDESWIEIIDDKNHVVYSTDENYLGKKSNISPSILENIKTNETGNRVIKFEKKRVFVNYYKSSYTGWKVIQLVPVSKMMSTTNTIGKFILITSFVCMIAVIVISIFLSRNLSKPIINLNNIIREVGKGDFSHDITIKREDEIGQLAFGVKEMIGNLRQLIKRTTLSQLKQKEAELKALQNQINPHFLYNTLESIQMKAVLNEQDEIAEMVSALGRLFKLSISKGKEIVKFQQELEHVNEYINIQKIRYGDRIHYDIDFDDKLKDKCTLKLILQPIVENAIFHGLEKKSSNGTIRVFGEIGQEQILISVEDNGIGMDNIELEKIQKVLRGIEEYESKMKNIGLKNVNDRIKLYFGEQFGLTIKSRKNDGTIVNIALPLIDNIEDYTTDKYKFF